MSYKVQFRNPDTGKGFIDGYSTAKAAKAAVAAFNAQFAKDGNKGIQAKYLGREGRSLYGVVKWIDPKTASELYPDHGERS